MKSSLLLRIATAVLLAVSIISCQKSIDVTPASISAGKSISQDASNYGGFLWETATLMPVSALCPIQVPVPWSLQSGHPIDASLRDDYKSKDGWVLVYNSFNPDNFPNNGDKGSLYLNAKPLGGLYFALYNRYRGLLRFYEFLAPHEVNTTNQLSHGLMVYAPGGTSSKVLNLEGSDLVDANQNLTDKQGFAKVSKESLDDNGGWYTTQYQIGFDNNFSSSTYSALQFKWYIDKVSVTTINLNGVEEGTLNGTITAPTPRFDWTNLVAGLVEIVGVASTYGATATTAASGLAAALQSAAQGGLAGNVTGFFSGIFGGSSSNSQEVVLSLNSTVTTTGISTLPTIYQEDVFVFPGQNATPVGPSFPLINYQMGVYNFATRPTVNLQVIDGPYPTTRTGTTQYQFNYSVDVNAIRLAMQTNSNVFSTDPLTGATLDDFKAEVVVLNPSTSYSSGGKREVVGNYIAYTGSPVVKFSRYTLNEPAPPTNSAAVRVSFHVTPRNGAPRVLIVKTFLASIIR